MLQRRFLAAGLALIGSLVGLLMTADRLKEDIITLQQEREEEWKKQSEEDSVSATDAEMENPSCDASPDINEGETE